MAGGTALDFKIDETSTGQNVRIRHRTLQELLKMVVTSCSSLSSTAARFILRDAAARISFRTASMIWPFIMPFPTLQ